MLIALATEHVNPPNLLHALVLMAGLAVNAIFRIVQELQTVAAMENVSLAHNRILVNAIMDGRVNTCDFTRLIQQQAQSAIFLFVPERLNALAMEYVIH